MCVVHVGGAVEVGTAEWGPVFTSFILLSVSGFPVCMSFPSNIDVAFHAARLQGRIKKVKNLEKKKYTFFDSCHLE